MTAKRKARMFDAEYTPPGTRKPRHIRVGFRGAELLRLLKERAATRVEMLKRGRYRVGLNAPATVSLLSHRGISFDKTWLTEEDEAGNVCRFMRYTLRGRLGQIKPIPQKSKRTKA